MGNSDVHETIVNLSDDAIIATDEQGTITIWNKAAERAFGQEPGAVIGKQLVAAMPDQNSIFQQILAEALENKMAGATDFVIADEQGGKRHFSVQYFPVQNGTSLVFKDVTALQQLQRTEQDLRLFNELLEKKMAERTAQLEATNSELESFSYSVSHDLRAPLRIINSYAQLLQSEYGEFQHDDGAMLLNVIQANVRKMNRQIEALLNLARMGAQKPIKVNTDMEALIQDILEEYRDSNKPVSFEVGKLPPVVCDMDLMSHVWSNLIANAVKFSTNGEVPEVTIGAYENENEVVYFVKDNGVGFDMRYSDKLFKVFQRLHSQSQYEGTGIGLALVAKIINKHEGKVWAEAAPNAGATFFFSLPLVASAEGIQ